MQLKGRKILYCGCSRGIGLEAVRALVKEGADVVGFARNMSDENVESVKNAGEGTFKYIQCDVTDEDMVFSCVDDAAKHLGGLDVVVTCVMQYIELSCEDTSTDDFDFGFKTNFYGPVWVNQAALPYLKESQGTVINFGSGGGVTTKTVHTSPSMYACSKAALHIWTKDIAKEWGKKYNINCNCIMPMIETPAHFESSGRTDAAWQEHLQLCSNNMFLLTEEGRPYGPEAVTPLIVFMCSKGSKYITGQLINCDGGMVENR